MRSTLQILYLNETRISSMVITLHTNLPDHSAQERPVISSLDQEIATDEQKKPPP